MLFRSLDVILEMLVLAIQVGEDQRFDVAVVQAGHFFSSSSSASIFSLDIQLHI